MKEVVVTVGEPNPRQLEMMRSRKKHIGYGGARGGGKSWAVRKKAVLLALQYAGIKILIVRRTYPELVNNHVNTLVGELAGIARYNKQEKMFRFANGSSIAFGYCNNDNDLMQYQGAEYDVIFLDEATQLRQEWIEKITACCRGVNDFPKRIYYTCNPGGPSHQYFKRLFIDRRFEGDEDPEDYEFIQALVTDNKALMQAQPGYINTLMALPPKLRDAWLYGRWDVFEGQFFEDFRPQPDLAAAKQAGFEPDAESLRREGRWCHVIEPFEPPRAWTVVRSYDFGYGKPFSCGWWAVDYDGRAYRILELYGCTDTPNEGVKWSPDEQFRRIRRMEEEHPWLAGRNITGVADPAIFDASRGESIAQTAEKHRVYFSPGDNKRVAGWMQLHYRLQFDAQGYPMLYVFDTCRAFIRTIPTLMYSTTLTEDLDTRMEDHVADETRYFCMSRPISPQRSSESPDRLGEDPLDLGKEIRQARSRANPFRSRI